MHHQKHCIVIIGPESSGSTLIAKTCAMAIDSNIAKKFNSGDILTLHNHVVIHKSLPEHLPPIFPDIRHIISEYELKNFKVHVILCTRDITISQYSRIRKFLKPKNQTKEESKKARSIMLDIMETHDSWFIWSYETFMFLGELYLQRLYHFLAIESNYYPNITDGNKKSIEKRLFHSPPKAILKLKRRLRIYKKRFLPQPNET